MSSVFLSGNQRELVKFMKPYVLYTQSKKKSNRLKDSDLNFSISARMHPAEEALLDFKPDENEIDGKLYDGIVELESRPVRNSRFISDHQSDSDQSDETDDSSEDEGYEIGGQRGFNTNMDDFLKNFGSVSARPSDKSSIPKAIRTLSSQFDPNKHLKQNLIASKDKYNGSLLKSMPGGMPTLPKGTKLAESNDSQNPSQKSIDNSTSLLAI